MYKSNTIKTIQLFGSPFLSYTHTRTHIHAHSGFSRFSALHPCSINCMCVCVQLFYWMKKKKITLWSCHRMTITNRELSKSMKCHKEYFCQTTDDDHRSLFIRWFSPFFIETNHLTRSTECRYSKKKKKQTICWRLVQTLTTDCYRSRRKYK